MNVSNYLVLHESLFRLMIFIVVLASVAIWEIISPRRKLKISKSYRWINNLGLILLNTILLRLIFPVAATGVAWWAIQHDFGIINYWHLSGWWVIGSSVVILDFAIYLQHVLFHKLPWLWKLHQVHHADLDYDVTTGARFHPLEIILSMLIKFAVVITLGIPVIAIIIFEILLNATAMFNHGNIQLPYSVDKLLRLILVTPDMHHVHHSVVTKELNSNFGFNIPWWDRLCRTYQAQPQAGHKNMVIGLNYLRDERVTQNLANMLCIPFKSVKANVAQSSIKK